jgi:transglutaminase-like putative cysteine protease
MMKHLLILLLLMLPVFSAYTGELVVQVEKVWRIESPNTIKDMTLNGTFLALNDFQEAIQMDVTEGAIFEEDGDEIKVIYHTDEFSGITNITATALVKTSYFFSAPSDPPYSEGSLNSSGLVSYNEQIKSAASSAISSSTKELEAIAALTDWVHEYIEYDLSYWGSPAPANETYLSRGGVCVGYAHLFIALARAAGFETRFVSGYAFAEEWQPHAWAEVRIDGIWIPVDPTFREFGALDARHIASSYSNDQSGVYDSLVAMGNGFKFNSTVSVRTQETRPFPQQIFAHTVLSGDLLKVVIYNPTDKYVTPTYNLRFPDYILAEETKIIVIPPGDSLEFFYDLDTTELDEGYSHTVPYTLSFQGLLLNDQLVIIKEGPPQEETPAKANPPCAPAAAIMVALFICAVAYKVRR